MRYPTRRPAGRQGSVPPCDPAWIFDDTVFDSFTDADKTAITVYSIAALDVALYGGPPPPVPPALQRLQAGED